MHHKRSGLLPADEAFSGLGVGEGDPRRLAPSVAPLYTRFTASGGAPFFVLDFHIFRQDRTDPYKD